MTKFAKGKHPGAVWKRVDFQIHTPRDPNWSGGPHLPGGSPEFEEARRKWALDFLIYAHLNAGLDAVAIIMDIVAILQRTNALS